MTRWEWEKPSVSPGVTIKMMMLAEGWGDTVGWGRRDISTDDPDTAMRRRLASATREPEIRSMTGKYGVNTM